MSLITEIDEWIESETPDGWHVPEMYPEISLLQRARDELAKHEWVKVSEILPKEDTPVEVYMADRGTIMLTHFYKDFALIRTSMENGFEPHGVTHWRIPEPPND